MKITEITVTAGRTIQHPLESYANLRPEVKLHAQLTEWDDAVKSTEELQATAEKLVEAHATKLKDNLEAMDRLKRLDDRISMYEREMPERMEELEKMREERDGILKPQLFSEVTN